MVTNKETFTNAFLAEIANAGNYRYNQESVIERYKNMLNAGQIKKTIKELVESGVLIKYKSTQVKNGRYSSYVNLSLKWELQK